MRITIEHGLGSPITLPATAMQLRDNYGNLIAVAGMVGGFLRASVRGNNDFAAIIRDLGLNESTETEMIDIN